MYEARLNQRTFELLTKQDVARIIKRSTRHIQTLVNDKLMPAPIRIGGGRPLWRRMDIETWIQRGCTMFTTSEVPPQ